MKLRVVSAVLWFLAGWLGVGSIAFHLGLSQAVGPLVGLAWAALVVIDPKDLVWRVGKGSPKATHGLGSQSAAARPQVGARS
jgi:hypothetical protein